MISCNAVLSDFEMSVTATIANSYGYLPGELYKSLVFKYTVLAILLLATIYWFFYYLKFFAEIQTVQTWISVKYWV